jgi:hypothetical protein
VIFTNSYQYASQFWFYTGKPSHEIRYYISRRTNYNLWPTDLNLLGKPVFFASQYNTHPYQDSVFAEHDWLGIWYDSSFSPMAKISIHAEKDKYIIRQGEALSLQIHCKLPDPYPDFLKAHPELATQLIVGVAEGKKEIKEIETSITAHQLITSDTISLIADTKDLPRGKYTMRFTIRVKDYMLAHNSNKMKLIIQ